MNDRRMKQKTRVKTNNKIPPTPEQTKQNKQIDKIKWVGNSQLAFRKNKTKTITRATWSTKHMPEEWNREKSGTAFLIPEPCVLLIFMRIS